MDFLKHYIMLRKLNIKNEKTEFRNLFFVLILYTFIEFFDIICVRQIVICMADWNLSVFYYVMLTKVNNL